MMQITYDEMLEKFSDYPAFYDMAYAVRAVVLRHKLKIDMNGYGSCEECSRVAYFNVPWPCPTIEDIQKEFKWQ